jgi:RNA polymerase sigma factor (sigma-70 family)
LPELEEIYKKYFKDVYLFIYSISKDRHIAEDMTSETFLKAMKSIDDFKGNCDIKVWLFQIAKNSYYSYLRKNKDLLNLDIISDKDESTDVEKAILSSEASKEIQRIIHKLPEPYREIFTLRFFGELSFKEIGDLFGKTDNWACVTFHRARNKIREEMRDYE